VTLHRNEDPVMINPGDLRHSVEIQKAPGGRDAAGQVVDAWVPVLTAYAAIEGTGSRAYRELFANNALASQSTDAITIRWPGEAIEIRPGMRVVFGANKYLIQAVDNVQHRDRKVALACMMISETSN
jgi:head-tail adaptor